jgi:hypothetical protein
VVALEPVIALWKIFPSLVSLGGCLELSGLNGLDTRLSHPIETGLQTFKLISLVGNDLRGGALKFSPAPLFASPNFTTEHN